MLNENKKELNYCLEKIEINFFRFKNKYYLKNLYIFKQSLNFEI